MVNPADFTNVPIPGQQKPTQASSFAALGQRYIENFNVPVRMALSGLYDLDRILRGFRFGDLAIIAGHTGTWKSGLVMNIANAFVKQGHCVDIYSYEMSSELNFARYLSMSAKVPFEIVEEKPEHDIAIYQKQLFEAINNAPDSICVFDKGLGDLNHIRSVIYERYQQGVEIAVVDYLQLVESSNGGNRAVQVATISRVLREIALELKMIVIGVSQLSRASRQEGRDPDTYDLKESGALENDASQVLFVQPRRYDIEFADIGHMDKELLSSIDFNECRLLLRKNRHGKIGETKALLLPNIWKFVNYYKEGTMTIPPATCHFCQSEDVIYSVMPRPRIVCLHCHQFYDYENDNYLGFKFTEKEMGNFKYEFVSLSPCIIGQEIQRKVRELNNQIGDEARYIKLPLFYGDDDYVE